MDGHTQLFKHILYSTMFQEGRRQSPLSLFLPCHHPAPGRGWESPASSSSAASCSSWECPVTSGHTSRKIIGLKRQEVEKYQLQFSEPQRDGRFIIIILLIIIISIMFILCIVSSASLSSSATCSSSVFKLVILVI